jgi:hypothetical protein
MKLPHDVTNISFSTYYGIGRALDYIWDICGGRRGSAEQAAKHIPLLVRWRATINKMRIYSSTEISLAERLNYNRACKDIDSLLFRLGKIAGAMPIRVSNDTEPESAE